MFLFILKWTEARRATGQSKGMAKGRKQKSNEKERYSSQKKKNTSIRVLLQALQKIKRL